MESSRFGVGLELPLLTAVDWTARPHEPPEMYRPQAFNAPLYGPFLNKNDRGPQVPVSLVILVPATAGLLLGGRFGAGSTCLDGPSSGSQGRGWNYSIEPLAQYVFGTKVRMHPYAALGPFAAHTCMGTTADQWRSSYYGVHVGGGGVLDLTDHFSLNGELRAHAGWGRGWRYAEGERSRRWDAFDLRAKLMLGMTYWL